MTKLSEVIIFLSLFICFFASSIYSIYLLGIFSLFFFIRKLYFDKFIINKDTLLILLFTLLYPIRTISDYSLTFSNLDIIEWKSFFILITLSLLSLETENINKNISFKLISKLGNSFAYVIFAFSLICIYQVFPSIYRFVDKAPIAGNFISNYFGFICIFASSFFKPGIKKFILLSISLLCGGSGSLGVIVYLLIYYLSKKSISIKKRLAYTLISIIISISIILPVFRYSQITRGRDLSNFATIDRYIIINYVRTYIKEEFNFSDYIIGKGPDKNINLRNIMERYTLNKEQNMVGGYLLDKFKTITGKTFHNDFLRIFVHYGFLGLFIFFRYTYKLFSYDIAFYFSFLFFSLFNSIITTAFCFSVVLTIFMIKGFYFVQSKNTNNLTINNYY